MTLTGWPLWWRLLAVGTLWGASFPLLRLVAPEMPPLALNALRGGFAALAVVIYLAAIRDLGPIGWRNALVLGTTNGWVPNLLTTLALARIEAAPAALIHAATPLLVALLAAFVLREERPGPRAVAGLALGFAGIAVILGPAALAGGASMLGGVLILLAGLSYAIGTVYGRRLRPSSPVRLALGQQCVAGAVAGLLSLPAESPAAYHQPAWVWLVVALLGTLTAALPMTLFFSLLARARVTDVATVGYLQPPSAALLGALLLGEFPSPLVLAGGLVVLAGVWLATTRR